MTVVSRTAGNCREGGWPCGAVWEAIIVLGSSEELAGWAWRASVLASRSMISSVVLLSVSPACAPSIKSLRPAAFATLATAGLVKVGAVRLAWAALLSLTETTVSMGDAAAEGSSEASSEASAAFVSEPTCSSSVLPIMIGEVGDSVA